MTHFRPAIEVLDARTLPSAVIAGPISAQAVQLAAPPSDPDEGGEAGATVKVTSQDVHFTHTGKVAFQDIHFTQTVSKASPKLF